MHAVYYFGRYDYQISRYRVTETDTGSEFGRDPRTGRYVISTVDSLRLILACYDRGLFLGNPYQWHHPVMGINEEAADLLIANAQEIPVPAEWNLRAYAWERPSAAKPDECASRPPLRAEATTESGPTRSEG